MPTASPGTPPDPAQGRVIVTNNVPDFESLRRAHEAAGNQLPGLIYTCDAAFPRTKAFITDLVAALAGAVAADAVTACGGVLWLRPAPPRASSPRRK
ncbi:MAG TPA: hypothetical protein VFB06_28505 [Streptosporangiaceae bacterium]|nr:hypothetical protein [Streptosporangiaceae bacterium]